MKYLLDTNVMVFMLCAPNELSERVRDLLKFDKGLCLSVASLWEIAIKQSIGKLSISLSISEIKSECDELGIEILPIGIEALDVIKGLPEIHKDPFDRLLVAQAQTMSLTIITRDSMIPKYDVQTIW